MCDLFQFQHQTIEKLKNKLSDNNLVMLMGEKESGKTFVRKIVIILLHSFLLNHSTNFATLIVFRRN